MASGAPGTDPGAECRANVCLHCGLPLPESGGQSASDGSGAVAEQTRFCCSGCAYIYGVIHSLGLDDFYAYREKSGAAPWRAVPSRDSFAVFDDAAFQDQYVARESRGSVRVEFALSGLHCAACVWLVERLPGLLPGVVEARVDFAKGTVVVRYRDGEVKLSAIASLLDSLGYTPHPFEPGGDAVGRRRERRADLLRIGVAAIAAGNSMMFAVSLFQARFSGITPEFLAFLRWASLVVCAPAVLYSALPFYRSAYAGLRVRTLHFDLPLTMAIGGGFLASAWNTFRGFGEVYFDSVALLIFLLLSARAFQRSMLFRKSSASDLLASVMPLSARRIRDGVEEAVFVRSLEPGDEVSVLAGELIPCDGEVIDGRSEMNCSILTGESLPVPISRGSVCFAGCSNCGDPIRVRAAVRFGRSRMGEILQHVEDGLLEKPRISALINQLGAYFVGGVLLLAVLCALSWYWREGSNAAFEGALAVLIVSCPCAFGLGVPVTLGLAVRRAMHCGMLITSGEALERLWSVKRVFLDKTGTITEGRLRVVSVVFADGSRVSGKSDAGRAGGAQQELADAVQNLESSSRHPVAEALRSYFESGRIASSWNGGADQGGRGVCGTSPTGDFWRIGAWKPGDGSFADQWANATCGGFAASGLSPVVFVKNGAVVAVAALDDRLRDGAHEAVRRLGERGLEVHVLSGDIPEVVERLAAELNVPPGHARSRCSPLEKAEVVRSAQEPGALAAMVGDGANDAAALQASGVGVAMSGGAEIALQVADVFLVTPSLRAVERLFAGAQRTRRVIYRVLVLSLIYNVAAISGAFGGLVNPFTAAVFMPLSSLTVVLMAALSESFRDEAQPSGADTALHN